MTRQKKTRNSGDNGPRFLPATEVRKQRERKEESKKSGAGGKPGQRNSQLLRKTTGLSGNQGHKDPRVGSKKPVPLLPEAADAELQLLKPIQPKASVAKAVVVASLTPEQELAQLEQDPYLQQLLERVEREEVLTGKDAKYFNRMTERYEQLLQQLGLTEDDEPLDPLTEFERTDWRAQLLSDDEDNE
ncbi:Der GTPase-activating protein YihI [Alkalimonas sp. MEB108]|uniref:Der GTPase-activating protein YihI n=1 Tax=Alkalimonas cellulosilytica TaxID=3058395 RepID=A0ABU7J6M3_9GAMM|nr:Der GTPase-activating protein YihI [Alkalimonas sp. MEB108]MEE2002012.1 Der GTPase-activating protein YihI [Alkalimonas sp. MEB108]